MASVGCWKCIPRRPSALVPTQFCLYNNGAIAGASFSTTAFRAKAGAAAKKPPARSGGTLKLKKKGTPASKGRPPAPGERKAMRKRIVLSNTNALEVDGMAELTPALLLDPETHATVVGIPGPVVDSLRAAEAFKITQGWGLFRRPGLLIREESLKISQMMAQAEKDKKMLRLVVDGGRVTGKSMMLLHTMTTAFTNGWVVLHIPEAQELVNAVTEYAPLSNTTPTIYSQNTYTAAWLSQIMKSNQTVLSEMKLSQEHALPVPIPEGISVARLCELGSRDPDIAWPFFLAVWAELTAKGRPPILLTLDSLSHIMGESAYRTPAFEAIHAHDLAIVRHFIDHLSGARTLTNGGAILAATSRSHAPISKAMEHALANIDPVQPPIPKDLYAAYDARAERALAGVQIMRLAGLSKPEARGLMEYWAASGLLRARVDEKTVAEKWAIAGNGVVGEIERGALRLRI